MPENRVWPCPKAETADLSAWTQRLCENPRSYACRKKVETLELLNRKSWQTPTGQEEKRMSLTATAKSSGTKRKPKSFEFFLSAGVRETNSESSLHYRQCLLLWDPSKDTIALNEKITSTQRETWSWEGEVKEEIYSLGQRQGARDDWPSLRSLCIIINKVLGSRGSPQALAMTELPVPAWTLSPSLHLCVLYIIISISTYLKINLLNSCAKQINIHWFGSAFKISEQPKKHIKRHFSFLND